MPLGAFRLNSLSRYVAAAPSGPVFGAGTAKPIWGITTTSGDSSPFQFTVPTQTKSGDLILIVGGCRDDRTVTFPTGFTKLKDGTALGGLTAAHIGYKISNGTEAGVTYNYTPSSGGGFTNIVMTIRGGVVPTASVSSSVNSNNPNSSALSGGTGNWLYMSFTGGRNITSTVNSATAPSGMSLIQFRYDNGAFAAVAGIYSSATSYDPAAWSLNASTASYSIAYTIRC